MTTITIDKRTKAGKLLLELAEILAEKNSQDVVITYSVQEEQSPYNKEFVQMVQAAEKEINMGKGKQVNPKTLWEDIQS